MPRIKEETKDRQKERERDSSRGRPRYLPYFTSMRGTDFVPSTDSTKESRLYFSEPSHQGTRNFGAKFIWFCRRNYREHARACGLVITWNYMSNRWNDEGSSLVRKDNGHLLLGTYSASRKAWQVPMAGEESGVSSSESARANANLAKSTSVIFSLSIYLYFFM